MIELNQKTMKVLTRVFWSGVVVATVGLILAVTTGIIERKNAVRTEDAGTPIAVPAE